MARPLAPLAKEFDCLVKDCKKVFDDYFIYARHLCSYHCLPINHMYLKFDDKTDFKNWKTKEEYDNNCIFIESDDKKIFKCHRSDYILRSVGANDLLCSQDEDERFYKVIFKF